MIKLHKYFQVSRVSGLLFSIFFYSALYTVSGQERGIELYLTRISSDPDYAKKLGIKEPGLLKKVYELNDYQNLWTKKTESFRNDFLQTLELAEHYGLTREKYAISYLPDSSENEIVLTDAILSFFSDIAFGTSSINFAFNGLGYARDKCQPIDRILFDSIQKNGFNNTFVSLQPSSGLYQESLKMLQKIIAIRKPGLWNEEIVKNTDSLKDNYPLYSKLYYLGILPSLKDTLGLDEAKITEALKSFERMFNLPEDGKLSRIALQKLNIPMADIQKILVENINKCRALNCIEHKRFIHINIPSATLKLYTSDTLQLSMRVIVGKPSTPTPVFCAKLNQVTFFPYWNVPRSIAVKEFLPIIKRDIRYLDNNGIQVLDASGHVIDENQLDWNKYNSKNFPYRFRQVTGCDNSLGIVKFEIEDPFSIYMHDTNNKRLFGRDKRFLSHGCIRLEKPYELATILLENKQVVDDFLKQRYNKNLKPVTLKLKETIPVFVSYLTVDVNDKNEIVFYDNIYRR